MAAVGRGGKLMASAGSRAGRLRALRGVIFDMDGCGSLANARSPPTSPPPPPCARATRSATRR